ncbi:MAG: GntR family transcriptional regulator [Cryobacterium sp.]|nr:GntR family transcriptional regulator [Cryobacterium sp.]
MILTIDPNSATPPFEQLRTQIRDLVASVELAPGTRLPTVRRLAGDLDLAPNTVARAYRELESDGIIETRGRHGSFVASHGDPVERQAQEAAAAFAERIRKLGVDRERAFALIQAALRSATDG